MTNLIHRIIFQPQLIFILYDLQKDFFDILWFDGFVPGREVE
jgi:hypothetical protein